VSGTLKSRWIETEIEKGAGEIILVPLRCRLEARSHRLRTVIQVLKGDRWVTDHKTAWVQSPNAHRLTVDAMDDAAQDMADSLVAQIEKDLMAEP
jgi:hypothetical protein